MFTLETSASAALNGSVALYASKVGKLFCGLPLAVTGPRLTLFGTPLSVRRFGSMVIVSSGYVCNRLVKFYSRRWGDE